PQLALAELEALASAFLSILFALFATRIAGNHAFGLQLLAQLGVELHQRARDSELGRISLAANSAAMRRNNHVERCRRIGRGQWSLRRRALRGRYEILLERKPVDFKIAVARTQINAGNRRLAASRSVVLNQLCHVASSS